MKALKKPQLCKRILALQLIRLVFKKNVFNLKINRILPKTISSKTFFSNITGNFDLHFEPPPKSTMVFFVLSDIKQFLFRYRVTQKKRAPILIILNTRGPFFFGSPCTYFFIIALFWLLIPQ